MNEKWIKNFTSKRLSPTTNMQASQLRLQGKNFHIKRKFCRLGVLALCLVCSLGFADSRIVGSVIDNNGDPISGARIYYAGTNVRACTDDNGKYALPSINGYAYTVRAQRTGFQPAESVAIARTADVEFSFVLNTESGTSYSDCKVRPLIGSKIYWDNGDDQPPTKTQALLGGIVIDQDSGQLLLGVKITTSPKSATVFTGANGSYFLYTNLKSGLYDITARMPGYKTETATVRVVSDKDKLRFTQADIALLPVAESAEGGSEYNTNTSSEESTEGGSTLID